MRDRSVYTALLFAMTAATVGCSQQVPTTPSVQTGQPEPSAQATTPQRAIQDAEVPVVEDRQVQQRTYRRRGTYRRYTDRRYGNYYPYYNPYYYDYSYYYPSYYPYWYSYGRRYTGRRTNRRTGRR